LRSLIVIFYYNLYNRAIWKSIFSVDIFEVFVLWFFGK